MIENAISDLRMSSPPTMTRIIVEEKTRQLQQIGQHYKYESPKTFKITDWGRSIRSTLGGLMSGSSRLNQDTSLMPGNAQLCTSVLTGVVGSCRSLGIWGIFAQQAPISPHVTGRLAARICQWPSLVKSVGHDYLRTAVTKCLSSFHLLFQYPYITPVY